MGKIKKDSSEDMHSEIGLIPTDWKANVLADLCSLQSGYAFKSDRFGKGEYKLITPQNFTKDGRANFSANNTKTTDEKVDNKYLCTQNDILVLLTDLTSTCELLGRPVLLTKEDGIVLLNQRIAKIEITSNIDKTYLMYFLLTERQHKWIKSTASGTTVRHSSNNILLNSIILCPPLPEQQKIARILSTWNKAIEKTEQLIDRKQQLKKGLMQQLLTGKVRFSGSNGNWKIKRIEELGTVIRGASPRPKSDPRYYGGNVPRLMVEDVTRDGKYVTPKVDFLTEEGSKLSRPCKAGTLTIVCSGDVGTPSFLAVDACIHDGFLGITDLSDQIDEDYLYYQMLRLKSKIERSATHGGVFTNLTTQILKDFEIQVPPLKEQKTISTMVSQMDRDLVKETKLLDLMRAQKSGLMQKLLTGEVRVKLK